MDFEHVFRKYRSVDYRRQRDNEPETETPYAESVASTPHTGFAGVTLYKGKALATEIETYRRRIQALLQFFDLIAPHWWDRLHPFKNQFVRRPSRSANLLRNAQERLSMRLARLTPRSVMPAAAAVVSIEERDSVAVLPKSLYRTSTSKERTGYKLDNFENGNELMMLALSIARRLGEIERSKQQAILYALDWINFDGRDLRVRARRTAMLAKHVKACLIESFQGVQAVITHYFRRRVLTSADGESTRLPAIEEYTDAKLQLKYAFQGITANRLNSTCQVIMDMLMQVDPITQKDQTAGVGILTDIQSEEMMELLSRGQYLPSSGPISSEGDDVTLGQEVVAPEKPYRLNEVQQEPQKQEQGLPAQETTVARKHLIERTSSPLGELKHWSSPELKDTLLHSAAGANPHLTFPWPSLGEASALAGNLDWEEELPDEEEEFKKAEQRMARRQARLEEVKRKEVSKSIARFLARKETKKLQLVRLQKQSEQPEAVGKPPVLGKSNSRETMAVQSQSILDKPKRRDSRRVGYISAGDNEDQRQAPARGAQVAKPATNSRQQQQQRQRLKQQIQRQKSPSHHLSKLMVSRSPSKPKSPVALGRSSGDREGPRNSQPPLLSPYAASIDETDLLTADFRQKLRRSKKPTRSPLRTPRSGDKRIAH
uniref:DUF5738 domain-containing protein n=1 Tax=Schistocephalus solidus TaxID=70667 RepID=A0A0X3NZZ9_SCHSO